MVTSMKLNFCRQQNEGASEGFLAHLNEHQNRDDQLFHEADARSHPTREQATRSNCGHSSTDTSVISATDTAPQMHDAQCFRRCSMRSPLATPTAMREWHFRECAFTDSRSSYLTGPRNLLVKKCKLIRFRINCLTQLGRARRDMAFLGDGRRLGNEATTAPKALPAPAATGRPL
jgi:hypothetical protein